MLGYRLISQESLLIPRSFCPHCKSIIAWYDNIPLISWVLLKGKCRQCLSPISWLYPFIESTTTLLLSALIFYIPSSHWLAYFFFFSALLITIRSDLETMLISRYVTIFLIPVGFIFSYFNFLPISVLNSALGSCTAYLWLYAIGYCFYKANGKIGIGQGDFELMAFIGSFIGMMGWWISLLIGSLLGSFIGVTYLMITRNKKGTKIPFGPFLAFGAISYVFFEKTIFQILLLQN